MCLCAHNILLCMHECMYLWNNQNSDQNRVGYYAYLGNRSSHMHLVFYWGTSSQKYDFKSELKYYDSLTSYAHTTSGLGGSLDGE
jgi:hypothetical protein